MKTIYKSLVAATVLASVITLPVRAQQTAVKDTTYNRQIMLEREFNPTLQGASKINTLPAVHEPEVKNAPVKYETTQPTLFFDSYALGDTGSGDIKTQIDYSRKRGYLSLAGGNYMNLRGALGIKIVDTAADQLDFYARHYSTNGDIKYADKEYGLDKAKAKYMNNFFRTNYQHSFEFLKWNLAADFENTSFNYYGNPFGAGNLQNIDKKQTFNTFGVETGVQSTEKNEFVYAGSVSFKHFTTKYGSTLDDDGVNGNILNGLLDIAAPFQSDKYIGVRVGAMHQSFSKVDWANKNDYFHSLTNLRFNPYFKLDGGNYSVHLGVNVNYAIDNDNKLAIAPDINAQWQFADKTAFYLVATGGINENNHVDMMRENRYLSPDQRIAYSHTIADGVIGIKSGVVKGLEFDIFGGYKYVKDEHFYSYSDTSSWDNVGQAEYYDIGTGHFGALLKTSLIPYTDLSLKAVGYFYNAEYEENMIGGPATKKVKTPWGLPKFSLQFNANVNPFDNLTLSMSYNLKTGRKAYYYGSGVKMKNINELNFRGEYELFDWLSINAQLNNVLNQKYETQLGYTHQGLNILGGVSFKF